MAFQPIYNLIEVANTHSGNEGYIFSLLDEFSEFTRGFGVKFQPFKYDEIASEDFEFYPVYQRLFFELEQWEQIIAYAAKTKDVWLDVSTGFSCQVLEKNLTSVKGIKLQSSMLFSQELLERLGKLDTEKLLAIVNIAGLSLVEIRENLIEIEKCCNFQQIILQIGFQDYPTVLGDSGLSKIDYLKSNFPHRLSFADHLSPEDEQASILPVIAGMMGVELIEKHVQHSTLPTEFDTASSMKVDSFRRYVQLQRRYNDLLTEPFLNDREKRYLTKTLMVPTAQQSLQKGQLIAAGDVNFRRSDRSGLNIRQLQNLQRNHHLLSVAKQPGETFKRFDFKKANIASIIACRLKSTRLPNKALLELRKGVSSVEVCLQNCLKLENVNHTILATSNNEQDSKLRESLVDGVRFHTGDPDDVIARYLTVIDELEIDIVLRFTGDCPYPSSEIVQIMLESHFEEGADYTEARGAPVGTSPQIINASALRKVRKMFPTTDYSEYMNGYLIYNPDHFKLNYIDLPEELKRDYRLTLDYPEDLEMMRHIEAHFEASEGNYSFLDVVNYLDRNPSVPAINQGLSITYKQDPILRQRIKDGTTYRPPK